MDKAEIRGYRSGFAAICGCPNAGKSTLLNSLIGQKIAIVSDKAQTTRNKITGVLSGGGYQIVFLDTPGVTGAKNLLGEAMQKAVGDALSDVDVILLVLDPAAGVRDRDMKLMERLEKGKAPVLALLNKLDIASERQMEDAESRIGESGLHVYRTLRISGATGEGLPELKSQILELLPEGPQYFPEDMITDQPERLICGEIVREKALRLLREEIPHGIGVSVDRMSVREGEGLTDIYATVLCERESHKGIIIGRNGAMLKKIGTDARREMEEMLETRVNLQLFVKVREDWRNKPSVLRELGYE